MPYAFGYGPRLSAETGTRDILNGFRLAFWAKDHWVGRLEDEARGAPLVAVRAAELLFVDVPLAADATVFPHEFFGHGGRLRELGDEVGYTFELPPPYSFTPSFTRPKHRVGLTGDGQLVVSQAGIAVEAFEAREVLRSSFAADTLNHFDSGLLFGIPIHEVVEATLPFDHNDVSDWTTLMAARYRTSARTLQRRYLVATSIAGLANPTFLYAAYELLWRFLVLGERTGPMPAVRAGTVGLWATTHVTPLPWALEYELTLLARWRGHLFSLAPRWGAGPGGQSSGADVEVTDIRVRPHLVTGFGLSFWTQPELALASHILFAGGFGTFSPVRRAANEPGAGFHADVRWEEERWFVGVRAGAKTAGIDGLLPIAPSAESVLLAGVLLGRP